jgi:hypothetical protein
VKCVLLEIQYNAQDTTSSGAMLCRLKDKTEC